VTQLEKLHIGDNPLKTLPEVVSSLTSLKELDIENCGLSNLPERFVCHNKFYITFIFNNYYFIEMFQHSKKHFPKFLVFCAHHHQLSVGSADYCFLFIMVLPATN